MQKSSRTCAMCDNLVQSSHVVCKDHYEDYTLYKNEDWFKALAESSRRQFEIDNEETAIVMGKIHRTRRSYTKLTETERKSIQEYSQTGVNPKAISKLTGVNIRVIYDYLYRFRKNSSH